MCDKKEVFYKGIKYTVTNPGKIVYSTAKTVRGCRVDKRPEILDQLNNNSEIKGHSRVRIKYLKEVYNLTELDYYTIVVCLGDESKLPKCSYVNPYTGEICDKCKKFRSLTPGKSERTGNRLDLFHDGCEEHKINAACQVSQRNNYKKGVTGLQKANRSSKIWRDKLREHALKQMQDGRSIFSPDGIRDSNIKSVKEFNTNPSINYYKTISDDLSINEFSLENCILIDRENYLRKGNPDDLCHYYFADFKETEKYFKLGVSIDLEKRSMKMYHGYTYNNYKILFTAKRNIIAEFEYEVKMKFKDLISLGNEAFSIENKDLIMSFIQELIKKYNN